MMLWRWVGLVVLVVGLIFANGLGGLPKLATAQYIPQITEIAWSPDETQIAVGYDDGRLEIRGVGSQGIPVSLMGHTLGITTIAWNPAGNELASGSSRELFVWDVSNGQMIADLNERYGYPSKITSLSWSRDGSQIMVYVFDSPSRDRQIWNATSLELITERDDHPMTSIKWSIGKNRLVMATAAGGVFFSDVLTFNTLSGADESSVTTIAPSPGGQRAVTGNAVNAIKIWYVPPPKTQNMRYVGLEVFRTLRASIGEFNPPLTAILDTAFTLSGNRVYSVSGSGEFAVWDAIEGGMISSTQLPDAPITAAAFNQLGTLLAYGDTNGILHLVDVATLVTSEILGDSIALFRASDGQATLINLPPNANPNTPTADNLITYDTGAPDAAKHGQWVMGDWDGDGVATPGVYGPNGVFYYTDGLGPSSSWATTDLGLPGGSVVVGRFGEGERDCIGIVTGATFTTTRDLTGSTSPLVQMLAIEFPTDADLQYGAGDFDGDGEDSIVIRQGDQIFYSNTPEDGPSQLVVGDWDADGVDSFGLYFVETGHFYGRNQTDGPLMVQQLENSGVGTSNINAMSWRFR